MLDTFSILTLHLATAYGVGIFAAAMAALVSPARFGAAIADFERSPGLAFLGAILALVMGLGLVMLHNLWTDPAAVLVSLLGWVILLKGVLVLAAPEGIMKLAAAAASSPARVRIWGVIALILAAAFLAIGLAGRASVSL
jgi:hypothetical protein